MVFGRRGYNSVSVAALGLNGAENGGVVAFASAGGKINFVFIATKLVRNFAATFLKLNACVYAKQMERRRITEIAFHVLGHAKNCLLTKGGGGGIIEVMNQMGTPLQDIVLHYIIIHHNCYQYNCFY